MKRKTPYISVNLTEPARDTLRQATLALTTDAQRRLSMSAVLIAALRVAQNHRPELLDELKKGA
ncbi:MULTISPECIES: hypothetical protein [unclassified Nocardiopsis]|uniref:hypothetical protein n=1 Tax=Nocardiopsis TaxID=2013 RepID=UPI00387B6982